ncbi:hypothetical protein [Nostoc sp. MG11]|uniref:hypothetical protein n=1 Tax=Nostoc sp. MG11 TaxID=2721166 RepID=UPI00186856B2|nr:hypothetical protein [Nostoc sp. MG11]
MLDQFVATELLVVLSPEDQQLLSGGQATNDEGQTANVDFGGTKLHCKRYYPGQNTNDWTVLFVGKQQTVHTFSCNRV